MTDKICSIKDCGKTVASRGYCWSHYWRLRKHGDPIAGRTAPGEPLRWIHEVALFHASKDCLKWPFGTDSKGYGRVWVGDVMVPASRYACELAHGAPPTPEHQAAHSCGKGHEGCVAPGHLSWKTRSENEADKVVHGTLCRGERHVSAKLTEAEARFIIASKDDVSQRELADKFGVSRAAVSMIKTGQNWSWLSEEINSAMTAALRNSRSAQAE